MSEKTNKLNISLIKEEYKKFDQIIDPEIGSGFPVGKLGTFYAENSQIREPDWLKDFFGTTLEGMDFKLRVSSARGVLLVRVEDGEQKRIFAITFGQGRHLLNDEVVEESFGLKVVLNIVHPDSLRSIDKTTLGSTPKQSREQISRESPAANFGIDVEQDLVNAVTGRSKDTRLGKTISGRDPLAVSAKVDVHNIAELLKVCLSHYHSEEYKKDFGWIDQIKQLRDTKIINALNEQLIERISKGDLDKTWMAPPDILDWVDVKGFRYIQKKSSTKNDLEITEFLAALAGKEVNLDTFHTSMIYVVSAKSDDVFDQWKAYKCLYSEVERDGKVYVLNNGKWYEIAKNFTDEVFQDFAAIPDSSVAFMEYNHANENAYNNALSQSIKGSCCMDAVNISHGGGHSKVEFCDVLTSDKKLLHVKRYSGSAQLSHLFAQGTVSGELMLQDGKFRARVNEKLPDGHKFANVTQRPKPEEYEVVFAVISKSSSPLEIPFFSKVTFRNAKRRLEGYGYKVTKAKIIRKKLG